MGEDISSRLRLPRQCQLVLLVKARLKEGKALGSEKVKDLDVGLSLNFYHIL
jgi:hypothetical protein